MKRIESEADQSKVKADSEKAVNDLESRVTRKCFCLATGVTAVHLVRCNFLGFRGFMGSGGG